MFREVKVIGEVVWNRGVIFTDFKERRGNEYLMCFVVGEFWASFFVAFLALYFVCFLFGSFLGGRYSNFLRGKDLEYWFRWVRGVSVVIWY